ncbi:MAG: DNA alkylation repair protein [Verrucomicrobia bacterium]|nr:DNA alkylation repair protein [Verrucomicrobiota bacterium]
MNLRTLREDLRSRASEADAAVAQRFFKTGPGEYGEGDHFIGVRVPEIRKLIRVYEELNLRQVESLLHSKIHEERLLALLLLVRKFKKARPDEQKQIYSIYLDNTAHINNWDLVDLSAEHIVGGYLHMRNRRPLHALAKSSSLWERRIAVLATFHFIRKGEPDETLAVAEKLLNDEHDLIHKAVGWMLREVGNRDREVEERFLRKHYQTMPRTMLRYAIEKFPEELRQAYLKGTVRKCT